MTKKQLFKIIEGEDWSIYESDEILEISQYSPAGEDFSFSISKGSVDSMIGEIVEYANGFDTEEHVELWFNSGADGVPSLKTLFEDAEDIQSMLLSLKDKIIEKQH